MPVSKLLAVSGLALSILSAGTGTVVAAPMEVVVLQGLDKVTARVTTMDVPVGATRRFGTLEIIPRACDKRPPEETPESAAFLDVWEVRSNQPPETLFRGWMFASSPALNALEHPVFDVWVKDCRMFREGEEAAFRDGSLLEEGPQKRGDPSTRKPGPLLLDDLILDDEPTDQIQRSEDAPADAPAADDTPAPAAQ